MKPGELQSIPLRVEKLFYDSQNRILEDIVRRIRKTGGITSTADYQIQKLTMFGNSSEFIESEIKRVLSATDAQMWELYDKAAQMEYVRNAAVYEQVNANFIPYHENEVLQSWVEAIVKQTNNEIVNLTQSMGFAIDMGRGKKVFTPLSQYYQTYLDRASMDIVTGAFDYNTVLRRTVKELTASGIRTVDYASGYSSRATVAARRAVLTGVNQLSAQINERVAKDLETDKYEVTWHAGHRPTHWWGGLVFTMDELHSVCGLGDVAGLCGANCYHSYYAFVDGASVRTYTDTQLSEMNAKEQEVHTWNGKEYNSYEATQKQRSMETTMRGQRSRVDLLKKGHADKGDIAAAQSRYQHTMHQYKGFSSKVKLPPQMERVYLDGLGRIAR